MLLHIYERRTKYLLTLYSHFIAVIFYKTAIYIDKLQVGTRASAHQYQEFYFPCICFETNREFVLKSEITLSLYMTYCSFPLSLPLSVIMLTSNFIYGLHFIRIEENIVSFFYMSSAEF